MTSLKRSDRTPTAKRDEPRSVNGFDVAGIQLYQTLGVRNHDDGDMSATRSDWK